jgi:hypothetical protein
MKRTPRRKACVATQGNLVAIGKTPSAAIRNLLRLLAIQQGSTYQPDNHGPEAA